LLFGQGKKDGRMDTYLLAMAAVVGYLFGSFSFPRLVTRLVAHNDLHDTELAVPGTLETFKVTGMGASAAAGVLGPKMGCFIGILDMLKVTLPTLAIRLAFPGHLYYLVTALAGMVGQVWPIFYRFKGGRGYSAAYGGLFAVDWLGAIVTSCGGLFLGLALFRDFVLAYIAGFWLLLPWMWLRTHSLAFLAYAVAVNILFVLAMIPDLRQYLKFRGKVKVDMDVAMQAIPMGRSLLRIQERIRGWFAHRPSKAD
jgi:acyl phosphate:glycerol-3-phosphate acyltransferase